MTDISALLSEIICNRCKTSLSKVRTENSQELYKCKCSLKIRVLLLCNHCQKPFFNLPYLQRKTNYCSLSCYREKTFKKKLKSCQICGKEFRIKAYLAEKGFGLFCSRICWFNLFKDQRRKIQCKLCKIDFFVYPSVYTKNPKFCSKICSDTDKRDYVNLICHGCHKDFEIPRSDINRGRGTFCSRVCYRKYDGESSIEKLIRLELEQLGEPFQQEVKIGKYYADFYLPQKNLIIECDGEYWHRSEKVKLRDKEKDHFIREQGYKIIRFSEEQIRMSAKNIVEAVLRLNDLPISDL